MSVLTMHAKTRQALASLQKSSVKLKHLSSDLNQEWEFISAANQQWS